MVEFALIAPVMLLFAFGVIDLGRAVFAYVSIEQAASDGARTLAAGDHPAQLPTNATVATSAANHQVNIQLAACPNGPISNSVPPANTGWIYITQVSPSATAVSSSSPLNAPGNEPANTDPDPGCSWVNPASGDVELQVTIEYNFVPLTPVISNLIANHAIMQAASVVVTEY
jgi:Flp pilus assembly protein TadG